MVFLAAVWALLVDIRLLNSEREHLLPNVLLALISMPLSQTTGPLYERWPSFFGNEFAQVVWVTVCGLCQALALYAFGRFVARGRHEA